MDWEIFVSENMSKLIMKLPTRMKSESITMIKSMIVNCYITARLKNKKNPFKGPSKITQIWSKQNGNVANGSGLR